MGLAHSPRIVTDGLVLAFDAGNVKSYDKYENLIRYSEDVTNGWGVSSSGTGTSPILTANYGIAPDGTQTADRVQMDKGAGTTSSDLSTLANTEYSTVTGEPYTQSVWLKTTDGSTKSVRFSFAGVASIIITVTGTWQKFVNQTSSALDTIRHFRLALRGSFGTSDTADLLIWGAQVERGNTVTEYYKTSGTNKIRGTAWTDLSGNGNNGTLTNSPTFNNNNGSSIEFDGTDDYISFASASELQFLNRDPYSLEVWMYVDSNPFGSQDYTGIFNREDSSGGSRDGYNLWLHGNDANNVNLASERFTSGTRAVVSKIYTNADFLNMWHHIIVTYDGTNIKLYRNAEEISSSTSTLNITNTSKALEIGRRGGVSYFNGKLNGQKIYNKALSASEISQNFNALRGRYGI